MSVRVEPFTLELIEAAIVGDDELAVAAGARVVPGWATFREALAPTRDALAADPTLIEWGPRLFVLDDVFARDGSDRDASTSDASTDDASTDDASTDDASTRDASGRDVSASNARGNEATSSIVGWGGFKSAPRDGIVELGYEIAEPLRGRGLATAAARTMRDIALGDARVTAVIAHTLAESNASNHILLGLGFRFDGTLVEPDEGGDIEVWRYRIDRP